MIEFELFYQRMRNTTRTWTRRTGTTGRVGPDLQVSIYLSIYLSWTRRTGTTGRMGPDPQVSIYLSIYLSIMNTEDRDKWEGEAEPLGIYTVLVIIVSFEPTECPRGITGVI